MTTSIGYRHLQDGAGRQKEYPQNTVDELKDMISKHLSWQSQPFQHERPISYYRQPREAPIKHKVGTKLPSYNSRDSADRSHGIVGELIEMINEHLATQLDAAQHERPTSSGTMLVDWDGTGKPKITYRNDDHLGPRDSTAQRQSFNTALALKPLPPIPSYVNNHKAPVLDQGNQTEAPRKQFSSSRNPNPFQAPQFTSPDGLQTTCRPARASRTSGIIRPAYTSGYDPTTHYSYDYNGRIMHVHRDAIHSNSINHKGESRLSVCSEYYAVDAEDYDSNVPLLVEPRAQTPAEQKKRDRVVAFVQKVLRWLEGLGIMKKMKEEWRRMRCGAR